MNRKYTVSAVAAVLSIAVSAEFHKAPQPENVPELMRGSCGEAIVTAKDWETIRRPEVQKILLTQEYGLRPVERPDDLAFTEVAAPEECFGGRALRKRVKATYSGPGGKAEMNFSVWIPKREYPVASFIHTSKRPSETANDVNGPFPTYWLPAEDFISRGFAAIAYCTQEVAIDWRDSPDVPTSGVFKVFGPADFTKRKPTDWGILSAWAWGMSRILDWIETEPLLDAKRVAATGLSRNGKAALIAGAFDERFAMTVSCCSGCSGAKLNHIELWESEHIKDIMVAEKWFCPNYRSYTGKDRSNKMPFDQHFLLAMVAPRLLYVSSATEDAWAGPRGEFAALELASPVWNLYGLPGLIAHGFPKADTPLIGGYAGYHLRTGFHDITRYDWQCYMDFAERHGWNLPPRQTRGTELETGKWQSAIDAASVVGGRVTVPAGVHKVGQLELKSNVELHLEEGAILDGSTDMADYRVRSLPYSEGTWSAVVSAFGATNVAVTGKGEIRGNGKAWPIMPEKWFNSEGRRPRGMVFADCRGVRLEGFTLRDAACWGIVLKCCDGVKVRGVKVDSHANDNNDGFDIEASNVVIEDCDVDSGDDAFCIKSNHPYFTVENILIRDCMARTHCNAYKIGTATHGTIRNVRFERCRAEAPRRDYRNRTAAGETGMRNFRPGFPDYPAGVGISAIAVENVDGGVVEDISFDGVELSGFQVPVFVRSGLRKSRECGTPPSDKRILRRVSIANVKGSAASSVASSVSGVDGCRVSEVTLRNVDLICRGAGSEASKKAAEMPVPYLPEKYPEATMFKPSILPAYGLYVDRADGVVLDNVKFKLATGTEDVRPPVVMTEN